MNDAEQFVLSPSIERVANRVLVADHRHVRVAEQLAQHVADPRLASAFESNDQHRIHDFLVRVLHEMRQPIGEQLTLALVLDQIAHMFEEDLRQARERLDTRINPHIEQPDLARRLAGASHDVQTDFRSARPVTHAINTLDAIRRADGELGGVVLIACRDVQLIDDVIISGVDLAGTQRHLVIVRDKRNRVETQHMRIEHAAPLLPRRFDFGVLCLRLRSGFGLRPGQRLGRIVAEILLRSIP